MNICLLRLSLIVGLACPVAMVAATPAIADNSWEEQQRQNAQMQRQALQQQAAQGYSPSVGMGQRWEAEWRQQHPGEPMPSFGALEKLHRSEIMNNTNQGFAQMRANRQAELQRNYSMAKQNQERENAARHITWSAQQWQAWDRQYDGQMRQNAQDYLNGVRQAGDIFRKEEEERQRRQYDR
jgi:hypothetical protein